MANEKTWSTVPPQALTADGGMVGQVQIADTAGFRVKAQAVLSGTGLPDLVVQIKRVVSQTTMYVGLPSTPIQNHALNISAYTRAAGATITQPEQDKSKIVIDDKLYGTYETDPVVAWRTFSVDQYGNPYSSDNPLPVGFDGTISIGDVTVVGPGPNNYPLKPNADGSINANIVETPQVGTTVVSKYNEAAAVPNGALTTINTYTVPPSTTSTLQKITVSGENIATFTVLLNNVSYDLKRTYFGGGLNAEFNYETGNSNGIILNPGDVLLIQVLHSRPVPGNFECRIQVLEVAS